MQPFTAVTAVCLLHGFYCCFSIKPGRPANAPLSSSPLIPVEPAPCFMNPRSTDATPLIDHLRSRTSLRALGPSGPGRERVSDVSDRDNYALVTLVIVQRSNGPFPSRLDRSTFITIDSLRFDKLEHMEAFVN